MFLFVSTLRGVMRTRTTVLLSIAAVLLAGGGLAAGVAVSGGDESPAATPSTTTVTERVTVIPTPAPSQTATSTPVVTPPVSTTKPAATTPPVPAVLNGAAVKEVFPGLTSPIPTGWVGEGSDQDSHAYADTSSCTTQAKSCPRVEFLSLASGANHVNYGSNPINQWAKNVCPTRSPESVVTLEPLVAGDVTILAYQLPCQGLENYAWHVPGRLLVMTGDATGGTAASATVQAVLRYSNFN